LQETYGVESVKEKIKEKKVSNSRERMNGEAFRGVDFFKINGEIKNRPGDEMAAEVF